MSSTITKLCSVKGLDDVKEDLVPEAKLKQEFYRDDDWDNRWNWDSSEFVYDEQIEENFNKFIWLNDCQIAISPFNDMLVIGRNKHLSIFHFKPDSNSEKNEFTLAYNTHLSELESDETLSNVILLPFVSEKKSLVSFHDWTAILVGFSSGYFRIYAENGEIILSHIFHDEPVLDIKCRTYSANTLQPEQYDEILILYSTAVVQIDGFTLYQLLRLQRNRLVNAKFVIDHNQTTLAFKKWKFETLSDGKMFDCVNVGSLLKNDFDSLVLRSINNSPINNDTANLFFTTGTNPYVGFYHVQEGTTHTIIDEISHALISKIKNVFSFFSHQQEVVDPRESIKPATNISCNLALFDERLGLRVSLSPNRRLAAVIDDFGRVILYDIANSIAVNIWKGYRNIEVGWIVVEEDLSETKTLSKQATFLVLYAKKRGILEIWCAQNGPRVGSFNVGKNCKLFYIDYTMLGLNHLILQSLQDSMSNKDFKNQFLYTKCILFNFDTGELLNIDVPFLCALTDRNGKRARDIQIFKDFKILLKKYSEISKEKLSKYYEDVYSLVLMLQTSEIRRECLDELTKLSTDVDLICLCAEMLHKSLLKQLEQNDLDFENKLVTQMCSRIIQVCRFYKSFHEKKSLLLKKLGELIEECKNPPDIQQLTENIGGWSGNDVARLLSLLAFRQSVLKTSSNDFDFESELQFDFSISDMLSHFTLYYSHLVKKNNIECYDLLPIEIVLMKQDNDGGHVTNESKYISIDKLSRFLFCATFCDDDNNINYLLNEICIFPSNLLLLLFTAWLNSRFSFYWTCWQCFSKSLFKIVDVIIDKRQTDDYETLFHDSEFDDRLLSPSWTDVIEAIYNSNNITSSLISVNMIKALINRLKLDQNDISDLKRKVSDVEPAEEVKETKSTKNFQLPSDNEWETLHLDKENLSLLTKQFEDLFLLDMLLKSNQGTTQPVLLDKWNPIDGTPKVDSISLSFILTSGPGIVSEIVAQWAVSHKIQPDLLIVSSAVEANFLDDEENRFDLNEVKKIIQCSNIVSESSDNANNATLIELLDHVRRCFPNCLESDILLINCAWEILLQWHHQPLLFSSELQCTFSYLEKVSNSVLKHNIASMIWRLFIQKRFEILCNLIEKMGKKPKDRICRRELQMDENNLEEFVSFCCYLLNFMIETSYSCETEPLPIYSIDDWWCTNACQANCTIQHVSTIKQNHPLYDQKSLSTTGGTYKQFSERFNVPLAVIAVHQKKPNMDLIVEYFHLSMVLQFIILFNMRGSRPLSLFSSSVRAYFFKDLYSFLHCDTNVVLADSELIDSRFKFICSVITAIVQTLPAHRNENDLDESRKYYVTVNKWFSKVILMGREWDLDIDKIRIHYVYDLYLFGCDPLADELLSTVSDIQTLSRQLMVVCGVRLLRIFQTKNISLDEVSFLPPSTIFWLKSLLIDPNCFGDTPLNSTRLLLEKIANHLYDDEPNFRISSELLSALNNWK